MVSLLPRAHLVRPWTWRRSKRRETCTHLREMKQLFQQPNSLLMLALSTELHNKCDLSQEVVAQLMSICHETVSPAWMWTQLPCDQLHGEGGGGRGCEVPQFEPSVFVFLAPKRTPVFIGARPASFEFSALSTDARAGLWRERGTGVPCRSMRGGSSCSPCSASPRGRFRGAVTTGPSTAKRLRCAPAVWSRRPWTNSSSLSSAGSNKKNARLGHAGISSECSAALLCFSPSVSGWLT